MKFSTTLFWHRDDYWADYRPTCVSMKVRDNMPWSLIAFYSPIDILLDDIGPTSLFPGSQYWDEEPFEIERHLRKRHRILLNMVRRLGEHLPVSLRRRASEHIVKRGTPALLKKGQVILMHHDMWHSGTPNILNSHRTMAKLQFERSRKPTAPTWESFERDWRAPQQLRPFHDTQVNVYRGVFASMSGWQDFQPKARSVEGAPDVLWSTDAGEREKLELSYSLALSGANEALEILFSSLHKSPASPGRPDITGTVGRDTLKRIPALALSSMRPSDSEIGFLRVSQALLDSNPTTRGLAARIAGNWCLDSRYKAKTVSALLPLMEDRDPWVRGQSSLAVGRLSKGDPEIAEHLAKRLCDTEEFVRQYSAESLVGFTNLSPKVNSSLRNALRDDLRDVKYFALETLLRAGQQDALEIALEHLNLSYFCVQSFRGKPY